MQPRDDIIDFGVGTGDAIIDIMIDSEVVEAIPVLGMAAKFVKATHSIRDRIFLEKMKKFVEDFESVSTEDLNKMLGKLRDDKEVDKIGSTLILALENADRTDKAQVISKVFKQYLLGVISQDQLFQSWYAISRCYVGDLNHLKEYRNATTEGQDVGWRLLNAGLLQHGGFDGGTFGSGDGGTRFQLNKIGCILVDYFE